MIIAGAWCWANILCFDSDCCRSTRQTGTFTTNGCWWESKHTATVIFPQSWSACYGCRAALRVVEENWNAQTWPMADEVRVCSHHSCVQDEEWSVAFNFVEVDAPWVEIGGSLLRVVLPREKSLAWRLNLNRGSKVHRASFLIENENHTSGIKLMGAVRITYHWIQSSMEAILAFHPAVSTAWLAGWEFPVHRGYDVCARPPLRRVRVRQGKEQWTSERP